MRYHIFQDYEAPFQSSFFLGVVAFTVLILGLAVYRWQEKNLLTSGRIRVR
jgi:hypothetical protein